MATISKKLSTLTPDADADADVDADWRCEDNTISTGILGAIINTRYRRCGGRGRGACTGLALELAQAR